ncbi:MAG: hypothetical protein IPO20_14035 [Gammaproteobacteria bacterium]|nr:hypothetical protein [Gammaproteobacteria bacterium]
MAKPPPTTASHGRLPMSRSLQQLAKENTPTRVIGLKMGRTEDSVRAKAGEENVSLKPTNQSPYNRRKP